MKSGANLYRWNTISAQLEGFTKFQLTALYVISVLQTYTPTVCCLPTRTSAIKVYTRF